MKTLFFSLIIIVLCFSAKAQGTVTSSSTVTPPQTCGCNATGWASTYATIGSNVTQKVDCGYQFSMKKGELAKLAGGYKCNGGCVAKFIFILKKVDGTVVQNITSTVMEWSYLFRLSGNYSLEVTPVCNGIKCAPCLFYFTVR